MRIETEFFPGAIGAIVKFHGEYYAKHWGFTPLFEMRIAEGLSAFAQRKTDKDYRSGGPHGNYGMAGSC